MRFRIQVATDGRAEDKLFELLEKVVYELAIAFNHSISLMNNNQADMSLEIINPKAEPTIYINIGKYYHLSDIGASYCFRPYSNLPKSSPASILKNEIMPAGCIAMSLIPGNEAFAYLSEQLLQAGFLSYLEDTSLPYRISFSPESLGNIVFDFANGIFIKAVLDNIYSLNGLWFEYCVSQNRQNLYIVMPSQNTRDLKHVSPYGLFYALAYALKHDLKLENEAICLYNVLNNMVVELWRTRDIYFDGAREASNNEICDIICEQIALAGKLMSADKN